MCFPPKVGVCPFVMPKGGHHFVVAVFFVSLVAFRATPVNICKSGDAGKIYSPLRTAVRNSQTDKGVLSLSVEEDGAGSGSIIIVRRR